MPVALHARSPWPAFLICRLWSAMATELPTTAAGSVERGGGGVAFELSAITTAPYAQLILDGTPVGPVGLPKMFGGFMSIKWSSRVCEAHIASHTMPQV